MFPVETFRSIQLWLTIAALILAPLFFGSVDQSWVAIWTVLLSISTLCGVAGPMNAAQGRVLMAFLALCCAYALVAIVQVAPHGFDRLNDPIWQRASEALGLNALPRISSRAEIPPDAIGRFLLLVTSFTSGFFVATSRRNSDTLLWFARYSMLAYAVYGLAALVLTPNLLLWAPKLAYRGSLTATFVNHNTAAAFLGAGAILWFSMASLSLESLRYSSIRLLLLIPANERIVFKVILLLAAGLTCFVALLLTGSRGGLICSCLGMLVAIILMIASRLRPRFWHIVAYAGAALALIAGWLSQTGLIGSKGLLDDARWSVYASSIEAVLQRPFLGAGAGTFADLFPSLRADDLSSWGVWDYAHSTLLEIAVEMGVPIAAMIVLAAAGSLFILARAALKSKDHSRSLLSAIAGIAVLSYLHSIIDFPLQIPGYLIPFGILLGCGLARAVSEPAKPRKMRSREFVPIGSNPGVGRARFEPALEESSPQSQNSEL